MNLHRESKHPTDPMYRLVNVTAPSQLDQLQGLTRAALGIDFPAPYVRRADSLALVDYQNHICGGAMLVVNPPFRSLESIPDHRLDHAAMEPDRLDGFAEINGVWLEEPAKSMLASLVFWTLLLRYVLGCGRSKFLFTFDNSNTRMASMMRRFSPEILYSGPTKILPGMKRDSEETIAVIEDESLLDFLKMLDSGAFGIEERDETSTVQVRNKA